MLYLFAGSDTTAKVKNYEAFLKKNSLGAEVFFISHNDFDRTQMESLYSGSGLFGGRSVVTYSQVLEREDVRNFVLEKLKNLEQSSNTFIFLEGKLAKPVLDAFKKATGEAAQINVFELAKERAEKYNTFILANDFGFKDKLNLWIHYRQAVGKGVSLEEISGVLFWKVKDMLLKQSFGKYEKSELENFAKKIAFILPEARRDGKDAEAAFEQFLIEALG
jgi:hypothetical protein